MEIGLPEEVMRAIEREEEAMLAADEILLDLDLDLRAGPILLEDLDE